MAPVFQLFLAGLLASACMSQPRVLIEEAPGRRGALGPLVGDDAPLAITVQGELVCLAEEMQKRYGVQIPPVHEHLRGIRAEDGAYLVILRNSTSTALFSDARFLGRTLVLTGRTFPRSSLFEVARTDWLKDGKVYSAYYWCEVCSIQSADPGPCACCQAAVELREKPAGGGAPVKLPELRKP